MDRYNSYKKYLTSKFGQPVLKIPVNAGFSCPNRDGTKSTTGCTFCDNRSFSPVANANLQSPVEQLTKVMDRSRDRFNIFLAYFQPFSNTYGNVAQLKAAYEPVLAIPEVIGLALGTRPDCFDKSIYDYLSEIAERTYLSVELGLQSGHDSTLNGINRGHSVVEFCDVVEELYSRGIETVAHVLIGLPGDTRSMILETAEMLARLPLSGVKIHQLMIVSGTECETLFNDDKIKTLALEEYADLLCEFLVRLRPGQHVHRVMANSKLHQGLIAPMWSADKQRSLSLIHAFMDRREIVQGSLYKS